MRLQATDAIVGQLGFSAAKSTDGQSHAEQGGGDEIDALFDGGGDAAAGGDEGDEGHVVRPAGAACTCLPARSQPV